MLCDVLSYLIPDSFVATFHDVLTSMCDTFYYMCQVFCVCCSRLPAQFTYSKHRHKGNIHSPPYGAPLHTTMTMQL